MSEFDNHIRLPVPVDDKIIVHCEMKIWVIKRHFKIFTEVVHLAYTVAR